MYTRSVTLTGSVRSSRPATCSSSIRCWRAFSMSPRTCVKSDRSIDDSAPGEMIRLASRNAHTSSSALRTRPSTSRSWASMNLRASVMRALRFERL